MKGHYYRRNTCRVCHAPDVPRMIHFPATPVGDAYKIDREASRALQHFPLDLFSCNACGLVQLLDVVSPELLYGDFTYQTKVSVGLPDHFVALAKNSVSKLGLKPCSLVIEIGSNDGTLLRANQSLGLKVLGIDPARAIAQMATAAGIPTLPELFTSDKAGEIEREYGQADLVVTNNTMANIDDLDDFVSGIRTILKPSGTLILETGYGPDIIHFGLFDTIYHEHLSYFSVESLRQLFTRHGMVLFDAERIPTKGGSLRCYVAADTSRTPLASVSDLVRYEEQVGFREERSFEVLDQKLKRAAAALHDRITSVRSRGPIGGYGASVGTTTFIYTFDLASKLDILFDDNPVKFGRFSPGSGIEVVPSDQMYSKACATVVILAWRYTDVILKKHEKYIAAGGAFTIPWEATKG